MFLRPHPAHVEARLTQSDPLRHSQSGT
jgi:hypothetical protein